MLFDQMIRHCRQANWLGLDTFSKKTGIHRSRLQRIESGASVKFDEVLAIVDATGVNLDEAIRNWLVTYGILNAYKSHSCPRWINNEHYRPLVQFHIDEINKFNSLYSERL